MDKYIAKYCAIKCANCRGTLNRPVLKLEFETALCRECESECIAHNNYINSVSKDYQPV